MNDNQYGYGPDQRGPYSTPDQRPYGQVPPEHFRQGGPIQELPKPRKRRRVGKVLLTVLLAPFAVIAGIGIVLALFSIPRAQQAADNAPHVAPATPRPGTPVPSPTTKPTTPKPTTKPEPSMTASQEQAVGKVGEYLRVAHFSRPGLIEQLTFEGFSKADATYGVDHSRINWNEQAAGKAAEYLELQHFSRSGLIKQLEFEGFTARQAAYGASKAGLK